MKKQEGIVLIVSLIVLIMVTLIAVTSANIIMANSKVVMNFEARDQVRMLANNAIEEALTTPGFLQGQKAFNSSCRESSYTRCYDLTGDNIPDGAYVTLSVPQCISVQPVRNNDLNVWADPIDASCYQAGTRENGFTKYSLCANSLWEVESVAYDPVTNAKTYFKHGLTVRAPVNLVATACGGLNVLTN